MSGNTKGTSTEAAALYILADARYECLRMAADLVAQNGWQAKAAKATYLRARHSSIGADLDSILEKVKANDDVIITTPKVNDDQKEAVISALAALHQKKVNYYWYHAPKWFFDAPKNVGDCVAAAKERYAPDESCTASIAENPHYQNDRPAEPIQKSKTDTNKPKTDTETSDNELRQFTDYRLMYYFMGADTIEATSKEIITVLTKKTIPEKYAKPLERFSTVKPSLAGRSDTYEAFKRRIVELGRLNKDVLIVGETGTGKEATAYFLHEFSSRRNKPFIAVNCACFTEELLASELFGHVCGSYSGAQSDRAGRVEEAHGGTIFLDEIPDASPRFQAMLLRFMQSGEYSPVGSNKVKRVDVKILAGAQPVRLGDLRDDIRHRFNERLNTFSIKELNACKIEGLPDIISMARNIAASSIGDEKIGDSLVGYDYTPTRVTHKDVVQFWDEVKQPEVITLLTGFDWPGNVRQLQTAISRYLCNNLKDSNGDKLSLVKVLEGFIAEASKYDKVPSVSTQSTVTQPPESIPLQPEGTTIIGNVTISPINKLDDIPPIEEVKNAVYQSVKDALSGTLERHKPKEIYGKLKISINTGKKYKIF